MTLLWKRAAALTFGIRGEDGLKVKDLRISFDLEKNSESNQNPGKILVYNLSPDSRNTLEKGDEDLVAILEIGYGDTLGELFKGDITKAKSKKSGAHIITEIELGDGDKALRESNIDKSYASGTDIKNVIKDVANSFKETANVVIGSLDSLVSDTAQNGISISGMSKAVMDKLIDKQGLEWNIQDSELQILEPEGTNETDAIVLTPNTGLIGSPERKDKGVEFVALIQTTKIKPGSKVKLESQDFDNFFKIKKVKFTGDTDGQNWYMMCEAVEL